VWRRELHKYDTIPGEGGEESEEETLTAEMADEAFL